MPFFTLLPPFSLWYPFKHRCQLCHVGTQFRTSSPNFCVLNTVYVLHSVSGNAQCMIVSNSVIFSDFTHFRDFYTSGEIYFLKFPIFLRREKLSRGQTVVTVSLFFNSTTLYCEVKILNLPTNFPIIETKQTIQRTLPVFIFSPPYITQ